MAGPGENANAAAYFVDRHLGGGRGQAVAFVDPARTLTYGGLRAYSARFAAALTAHGIGRERRVALVLLNASCYFAATYSMLYQHYRLELAWLTVAVTVPVASTENAPAGLRWMIVAVFAVVVCTDHPGATVTDTPLASWTTRAAPEAGRARSPLPPTPAATATARDAMMRRPEDMLHPHLSSTDPQR